ncbi:uncharacterized protein DNG_04226 [Cephalotrichum gorgonifer]|uniref:Transcription factor domain-containing protein n=1 Tax=Cephalotrichum gorgonifer TaxID=2041049 RepID=A0AAE8MXP3_9PEZI|nr:uncharacterized protein DNG_04226 [Cephalotrichum gorgonifer]
MTHHQPGAANVHGPATAVLRARSNAITKRPASGAPHVRYTAPERASPASVDYLLGLTDPEADSMVEVFNKDPVSTDEELSDAGGTSASDASPIPDGVHMDYSFFSSGLTHVQPGEFSDTLADAFIDYGIQFDPSCSGPNSFPSDDGIAGLLSSILSELDSLHQFLGANKQTGSGEYHFDMASAQGVLTPENLRRNISTYFQTTNFYHALIHRATFSIEHAQPALVLSMFLCGSMYRRKKDQDCRDLFDIAEEYAFSQLNRAMMASITSNPEVVKDLDSSLQAATLMHGLQWVMNSVSSRRRNLALRLPQLVSAVRELGYTRLKHSTFDSGAALRWEYFITLESRIRWAH